MQVKSICMQPSCEVLWVFSGYADYFFQICDIPIVYTLFSTVLGIFR